MTPKRLLLWSLFLSLASSSGAVVRTVCASGCDHTTIAAAEAAAGANDNIRMEDSGIFNEAWTPGGSRIMTFAFGVSPQIGQTAASSASRSVLLGSTGGGTVTIDCTGATPVFTTGLDGTIFLHDTGGQALTFNMTLGEILCNNPNGNSNIFRSTNSAALTFDKVIWNGNGVSVTRGLQHTTNASSSLTLRNCVFFNFDNGGTSMLITGSQTGSVGSIINCTIADAATGLNINEKMTLTNNIFADNTDDILESDAFVKSDGTFNIFEQEPSTGWPASNFNPPNIEVIFVDAPSDNYRLDEATTIAIDDGTDASAQGVTDDFDGDSRPQGVAYDIGFDEVPVAGMATGSLGLLGVGL